MILYKNFNNLQEILLIVHKEFWPYSFGNTKLKRSLKNQQKLLKLLMYSMHIIALSFASQFIALSIFTSERRLPFRSKFPFEWKISPFYELLFIFQVCTNILVIITSILGHDFLFVVLMVNLINQFRVLKGVLRTIGTKDGKEFYIALEKLNGQEDIIVDYTDAKMFRKCVIHHIKLLRYVLAVIY